MTTNKALSFDSTDHVLSETRVFNPAPEIVEQANITAYQREKGFQNYDELHKWSVEHFEEFWAEMASQLHWFKKPEQTLDWSNKPFAKWFSGGTTNISYNCLDRHKNTPVWNKIAFHWEGEDGETKSFTYADLYRQVNQAAKALQELGVKKGDRVTIYMPRIIEQIVAMLAVVRLGAAHSVVFGGFAAQALVDRIEDADTHIVITADGFYQRNKLIDLKKIVDEAVSKTTVVEKVLVVRRTGNEVAWNDSRDIWWHDIVGKQPADQEVPAVECASEDLLFLLYTSGSTGKPKGIVHTTGGYMTGVYATIRFCFDLKPADVYWCTADPGWVTGHSYILYGPLMNGTTSLLYEGAIDYPDPGRWWKLVEKYKTTIFYTAPTAIRALMKHGDSYPSKYDLSSLRILGTVGEPINPEAWLWYRKITGDRLPIIDTWWQTETGGFMIAPNPATPLKPGSATKPFLGIDAAVVNQTGEVVGPQRGGFLIIRKPWPSMLRTIFKDDERYRTYWETIPDVYFAGDAAHMDADGYFWIQGRVDDVIKKAGHRLGSMEIESSLVSHPAVAEAAVIGKPDDVKGEMIKAFVILKAGQVKSDALIEELRLHVRATVGPVASPDEIELVDALPKTRSGKIMRRVLKARELGQPTGDLSTLEG